MRRIAILIAVAILVAAGPAAAWPPEVETVTFPSPADSSPQKTLLYRPPGD